VADTVDALSVHTSELFRGLVPERPFLIFAQYSMGDPTRAPAGKETAWAYTHVPLGATIDEEVFVQRMEDEVERLAPGFRALVRRRHVFTPRELESANPSLVGGAINGGTAQLHQQFVFRPTPGLGRPETPVARLYLASSSAHPGGGVHGGPGAIAARAALTAWRARTATLAVGGLAVAVGTRRRARGRRR